MSQNSRDAGHAHGTSDAADGSAAGPGAADVNAPLRAIQQKAKLALKLQCNPGQWEELLASPTIVRYPCDEGKPTDLTTIYYDTPDLDLRKSGSVLRVRTNGARFLMTMKCKKKSKGGSPERALRKATVESMEPDLAALSRSLPTSSENGPLNRVFSTELQRQMQLLHTPLGIVEMALNEGRIIAGERSEDICEIRLRLRSGGAEALFQLTQEIVASFELRPSIRGTAARGYDLALDNQPQATKARKTKFEDGVTLDDAMQSILRSTLRHLLENQPAALDGRDPEGLHQYRVALRRLRSVLGFVRSIIPSSRLDELRQHAKQMMADMNDARNWDVFVAETCPTIVEACPSISGFDVLDRAAEVQRAEAHDRARAAITDPHTGRFQIALGLWIEQKGWRGDASPVDLDMLSGPARVFAAEILDKLHRKALKRGRNFKSLVPEQRHKLRIAVKKLRYAAEFFLPLLGKPKRNRRYLKALSALQDQLGRYNDAAVTEQLIQPVIKNKISATARHAAGVLVGWQAGRLGRDDAGLVAAWKKFRGDARPWATN